MSLLGQRPVIAFLRRHWSLLLLSGVPVAIAIHGLSPDRHIAIFFASVAAIVPLAGYIGRATEDLAQRLGTLSTLVERPLSRLEWTLDHVEPKTAPLAREA
jgi:hypothetical protein